MIFNSLVANRFYHGEISLTSLLMLMLQINSSHLRMCTQQEDMRPNTSLTIRVGTPGVHIADRGDGKSMGRAQGNGDDTHVGWEADLANRLWPVRMAGWMEVDNCSGRNSDLSVKFWGSSMQESVNNKLFEFKIKRKKALSTIRLADTTTLSAIQERCLRPM